MYFPHRPCFHAHPNCCRLSGLLFSTASVFKSSGGGIHQWGYQWGMGVFTQGGTGKPGQLPPTACAAWPISMRRPPVAAWRGRGTHLQAGLAPLFAAAAVGATSAHRALEPQDSGQPVPAADAPVLVAAPPGCAGEAPVAGCCWVAVISGCCRPSPVAAMDTGRAAGGEGDGCGSDEGGGVGRT